MRKMCMLALLGLTAGALGSVAASPPPQSTPVPKATSPDAERGKHFAEAHCSECHATTPLAISPNPEAPTFESVVNTPGLTHATLREFLTDSHNYPATMNFEIASGDVDDLAAYMLTLREH